MTESIYIPRGVNTEALSRTASWDYQPEGFKVSFCNLIMIDSRIPSYQQFDINPYTIIHKNQGEKIEPRLKLNHNTYILSDVTVISKNYTM